MSIYDEIRAERVRQNEKWGEQNHPSVIPSLVGRPGRHLSRWYRVPPVEEAQATCDEALRDGKGTWTDIALEEFCESISAFADGTEDKGRAELVQLAAVIVQWIECIDRRKKSER